MIDYDNVIPMSTAQIKFSLVGAIHFPPLPGYAEFPGFDVAIKNARADLISFQNGGADAIIFENNYDVPHTEFVKPEIVSAMTRIIESVKNDIKIPFGISVLWNDYRAALDIALATGGVFIRVPVFVDTVKTQYGIVKGNPSEVIAYRNKIGAQHIKIYTDIHVKHSEILSPLSLEQSALSARDNGSDALIITGKWTGIAPDFEKLQQVRSAVGDFPIFCGSGVDINNIKKLQSVSDGAIVSTSLKEETEKDETNVKAYSARINQGAVKAIVRCSENANDL